jgi:hypothetical protein
MCHNADESNIAFEKFQLAPRACKPPCKQLITEIEYSQPQQLLSLYLSRVYQPLIEPAYYIKLPSTVKESRDVSNYGFITYIADVSGWYNLFLGGSVLSFWDKICMLVCFFLEKLHVKYGRLLTFVQQKIIIILVLGILLYIFTDCVATLMNSPSEISTILASNLNDTGLSICLRRYTFVYEPSSKNYVDVANTSEFWINGANYSSKIMKLSVKKTDGEWAEIWNSYKSSSLGQTNLNIFKSYNIISDTTVIFCHFLDFAALPFLVNQVMINAVDDVILVFHLSGQILRNQNFYQVANKDTIANSTSAIYLYESGVGLQLEETSFQKINSKYCQKYDRFWTYDDCLLDSAFHKFGNDQVR